MKSSQKAAEYMESVSQDVFGIEEFREIHHIEVLVEVIRMDNAAKDNVQNEQRTRAKDQRTMDQPLGISIF